MWQIDLPPIDLLFCNPLGCKNTKRYERILQLGGRFGKQKIYS